MRRALTPGSTIGIIGGGQLARMMLLEARRMGYRGRVLTANEHDPAVSLADGWVQGALDDPRAAHRLAETVDVVTVDTEHVPATILASLESACPVHPSARVLSTIQDRQAQRAFLGQIDAPQPACVAVSTYGELEQRASSLGYPCVLKSRRAGYDGKGQTIIRQPEDLAAAWAAIGEAAAMLESFVAFDCEISVLLARNPQGELQYYPLALNVHRHHVLHATIAPAPVSAAVETEALAIARRVAEGLDHVGMMAVEMFLVDGARLLVNEIAPRPHNSGHYTFGACVTSQFEQHVRAVVGLALGDPSLSRPAAMVNLFGELWSEGREPDWLQILACPQARLHLYGKREARPGRKMGHVLVLEREADQALHTGQQLLKRLEQAPGRSGAAKEICCPS